MVCFYVSSFQSCDEQLLMFNFWKVYKRVVRKWLMTHRLPLLWATGATWDILLPKRRTGSTPLHHKGPSINTSQPERQLNFISAPQTGGQLSMREWGTSCSRARCGPSQLYTCAPVDGQLYSLWSSPPNDSLPLKTALGPNILSKRGHFQIEDHAQ